ncbi:unnamed protein product [Ectocarpus sp. CCAP 1310/34]|nr:unnamed protein product [Ectocarpus sp. CCAP 1310/34]
MFFVDGALPRVCFLWIVHQSEDSWYVVMYVSPCLLSLFCSDIIVFCFCALVERHGWWLRCCGAVVSPPLLTSPFDLFSWSKRIAVATGVRDAKSDTLEFVQRILADMNGMGTLGCFRMDNGGEFTGSAFTSFFDAAGIRREYTAPDTPKQNTVRIAVATGVRDAKSDTLEFVQRILADMNGMGTLGCFRMDNGGEFTGSAFTSFFDAAGIRREYTAPDTPKQNTVV